MCVVVVVVVALEIGLCLKTGLKTGWRAIQDLFTFSIYRRIFCKVGRDPMQ